MDYIAQIKLGSKVKILAWKMMISLMQVVYLFKIFQQTPLNITKPSNLSFTSSKSKQTSHDHLNSDFGKQVLLHVNI